MSTTEDLQDADVEHIMYPGALWKAQTVCHLAKPFGDVEQASEPRAQLAARLEQQRLGRSVKDAKPDPVAHLEHRHRGGYYHSAVWRMPSLEEAFSDINEEGNPVLEKANDGGGVH